MDELCDMIIRMGYEWKIDINSFYNTFPATGIFISIFEKIAPVYMADKENWLASDIFDDVNFLIQPTGQGAVRVNPYSTLAQSVEYNGTISYRRKWFISIIWFVRCVKRGKENLAKTWS